MDNIIKALLKYVFVKSFKGTLKINVFVFQRKTHKPLKLSKDKRALR
jgi:hypothetical protein